MSPCGLQFRRRSYGILGNCTGACSPFERLCRDPTELSVSRTVALDTPGYPYALEGWGSVQARISLPEPPAELFSSPPKRYMIRTLPDLSIHASLLAMAHATSRGLRRLSHLVNNPSTSQTTLRTLITSNIRLGFARSPASMSGASARMVRKCRWT